MTQIDNPYWGGYFQQQGWVCPRCNSVWAPMTPGCYSCNNPKEIKTASKTS